MTPDNPFTPALVAACQGLSYADAHAILARDLGRPLTPDERQEVWAATDGDAPEVGQ